jgi:diaminopimelate epimerase
MIRAVRFEKWQALGNDYLIFERAELTPARVRRLCDPHRGPGADGVLTLHDSDDPSTVARLRIFNPDGSEAELSGNGAREALLYLRRAGWTDRDELAIETAAGRIAATLTSETTARVEMGTARLASKDFPGGPPDGRGALTAAGRRWSFQHVSIGNPQCAIRVADPDALDLATVGPQIERAPIFPNRTNVSFWRPTRAGIRARIFERGVGETSASGTGACGAAVAHVLEGGRSPVTVALDGGRLEVEVGAELAVRLTGWAVPVYRGQLSSELVRELETIE